LDESSAVAEADARRWVIILAGGEGERMQSLVQTLVGTRRPKQYCAFDGERTMLERTHDRAVCLVRPDRIVTVIGSGHSRYLRGPLPGLIVEQPANRDTAPGIFFPAAYIHAADPEATVVIMPSDHHIAPVGPFLAFAQRAACLAEEMDDKLILLGAVPNEAQTDYGWIEPAATSRKPARDTARQVVRFHEKPSEVLAKSCFERGFLWNTMVMAVKSKLLWTLGARFLPDTTRRFEPFIEALRAGDGRARVDDLYRDMTAANFSRDILERGPEQAVVLPMEGVHWNDWGRPERLAESLRMMGRPMPASIVGAVKKGGRHHA